MRIKLYKTIGGPVALYQDQYFLLPAVWDELVNDDHATQTVLQLVETLQPQHHSIITHLLPTIGSMQELWACGVTYLRSKVGRQYESKGSGGADFYARVYEAERPEVFFKATPHRIVGHLQQVGIRKDSVWDVPEPELTLVVTASGKVIGYTIGNDMSSRSIEGENPLYLPQAKTYDSCAALGPCILLCDEPLSDDTSIQLSIHRNELTVFDDTISLSQLKRSPQELVSFVFRACSFPYGCLIMTGTGIVPGNDFTLQIGDVIHISIDYIGTLINTVKKV